ncbi:hypothetical protein PIB30_081628 [Stylosanthes scabra]|uniref:Uncharacterized protein n=1 Tax=Stylosanthes scabra TaxID=79078 RepID=A0ABU6YQP4_9FABA|nr:hypothetical protein [Stylosanthes scabra]
MSLDAPLNEKDVENLNHEEVHEYLEEVEEENEDQEAEDVDHEVEDKDKEPKGIEIIHFASSKATPSKLPSELQFQWVNFSNLKFIGPQHYALLEMDDQVRALCGVLDKKKMDSLGLDESRKNGERKLQEQETEIWSILDRAPCLGVELNA